MQKKQTKKKHGAFKFWDNTLWDIDQPILNNIHCDSHNLFSKIVNVINVLPNSAVIRVIVRV